MKIPESNTNHGAYYTNEENGQWQGNGVIVDAGVGGGVVGSGDAGFQPSLYPIPHESGYVMSGPGYYPAAGYAAAPPDDFADYMWMENEEEFDKQVMQQLEEEALMEQCIEAMLEDERRERNRSRHGGGRAASLEQAVSRSTLNPLAAEFVPSFTRSSASNAQDKEKPPEPAAASSKDDKPFDVADTADKADTQQIATNHDITNKHEPTPPPSTTTTSTVYQTEAPTEEPSIATAITPTDSKTDAPVKPKSDVKKGAKSDVAPTAKAKSKPHTAKSEPKVATVSKCEVPSTKREVKTSRSEEIVSEAVVEVTAASNSVDLKSDPIAPLEEAAPSGIKPINYAAAAKANKPKKATTPPAVVEKSQTTTTHQTNSVKTSASTKTTDIRTEKPTSREKLATAPKATKSTEKLRKNSSKMASAEESPAPQH